MSANIIFLNHYMRIGKHIFYYFPQPFCHEKFKISGSQSGRNQPLGGDFEGQRGDKTKGGDRGKTTQGEKRSINNNRSLS